MVKKDLKELWVRYKQYGDAEARDALILAYTPMVKRIVDRMNISPMAYMDRDDLLTQAVIGLIDAVEKCELERCEQFLAYAQTRIRGAVIDGIREMDWVPRVTRRVSNRVENARGQLNSTLGRAATNSEIAEALSLDVEQVEGILAEVNLGAMFSLDDPLSARDGEGATLVDTVPHPNSPDPAESVGMIARRDALAAAIEQLNPDERLVITLYYYEDLTLKEIGKVMDRTEARICQIHKAALKKIRVILQGEKEIFAVA
ncbi:MAG TPA: FliA/WhiG family RNA polymerase sigma factor [Armatimonadota bacterium]|nr:FliA/WhiG family RNA polymerase sigma factor [Armatimonadota bacterium]